jgi:hypothetical protein
MEDQQRCRHPDNPADESIRFHHSSATLYRANSARAKLPRSVTPQSTRRNSMDKTFQVIEYFEALST